jgi:hypothetical protein
MHLRTCANVGAPGRGTGLARTTRPGRTRQPCGWVAHGGPVWVRRVPKAAT